MIAGLSKRVRLFLTLFFFAGVFSFGCREGITNESPSSSRPFLLSLTAGDHFTYDSWTLDEFGYVISSSRAISAWKVTTTGQVYQGRNNVVTVLDSVTSSTDSTVRVDTLYFTITADGDIYQYGFLAHLVAERLGRSIVPQWDRIAAFSVGFETSWYVGALDSVGQEPIYGTIDGVEEMFSADVNGVQTVFPTHKVELQGTTFDYLFRVSAAPSAIVEILEAPMPGTDGGYQQLQEMVLAPRP